MNIPLNEMSIAQKLDAIAMIWDSLSADPASIPIPDWQRDELAARSQRLDSGQTSVSDWDEAAKRFDQLGQ